mmetsp:Transcript_23651/g.66546  ORF Transcript_23651/g.66546 Transcript_23651/m.66546 type:complete len:206 (-) Transcript_23651:334-951(-)
MCRKLDLPRLGAPQPLAVAAARVRHIDLDAGNGAARVAEEGSAVELFAFDRRRSAPRSVAPRGRGLDHWEYDRRQGSRQPEIEIRQVQIVLLLLDFLQVARQPRQVQRIAVQILGHRRQERLVQASERCRGPLVHPADIFARGAVHDREAAGNVTGRPATPGSIAERRVQEFGHPIRRKVLQRGAVVCLVRCDLPPLLVPVKEGA